MVVTWCIDLYEGSDKVEDYKMFNYIDLNVNVIGLTILITVCNCDFF